MSREPDIQTDMRCILIHHYLRARVLAEHFKAKKRVTLFLEEAQSSVLQAHLAPLVSPTPPLVTLVDEFTQE